MYKKAVSSLSSPSFISGVIGNTLSQRRLHTGLQLSYKHVARMAQLSQPFASLEILGQCDNFPYYQDDPQIYLERLNSYYHFRVNTIPATLGYVLPEVADVLAGMPNWSIDNHSTPKILTLSGGTDEPSRSAIVAQTMTELRLKNTFKDLEKWRDELKPVYGPERDVLFTIERSAVHLLGVVTYGVHLTSYIVKDGEYKIWISKRAPNKSTYPGFLDNTVAGGVQAWEVPFESLIREAQEEASIPETVVRARAKSVGTISYFHIRDERAGGQTKLLQPDVDFLFECELPANIVPRPCDLEVEEFQLWSIDQIKAALHEGKVKPAYIPVMLDFFVRHGILHEQNEPNFVEIVSRLHRKLEFPLRLGSIRKTESNL